MTSHGLAVDLWDVDELLSAAARAERVGDGNARARHLDGVLRCWRGEPLGDLDRLDELLPQVQHVRERLMDVTLALGEARLAAGDAPGTETCAERVLSVDPYAERALRLLIAAPGAPGRPAPDRRRSHPTLSALQELAVEPQPQTSGWCCATRAPERPRSLSTAPAGHTREFGDDVPLPARSTNHALFGFDHQPPRRRRPRIARRLTLIPQVDHSPELSGAFRV